MTPNIMVDYISSDSDWSSFPISNLIALINLVMQPLLANLILVLIMRVFMQHLKAIRVHTLNSFYID